MIMKKVKNKKTLNHLFGMEFSSHIVPQSVHWAKLMPRRWQDLACLLIITVIYALCPGPRAVRMRF